MKRLSDKYITLADWAVTRYQRKLVNKVLRSGRLTYGPMTKKLEEGFAKLHNRKHALFTNSGTSALKIVLHSFKDRYGWKDGDEVIIPSVTFVATMNVVVMNNLKPVMVDVRQDTVNMNPELIEKAITKKTKAIIVVHLLGQPADMAAIMKIARKNKLKVIEDSCETMFVSRDGLVVGSQGDAACFSTYLAHLMVTGVGGFITTNDDKLAPIMRSMMFHGRDESYLNIDDNLKKGKDFDEMVKKRFYFARHGYSDRATELEAAIGLGDLKTHKEMIKIRQENARYFYQEISGVMARAWAGEKDDPTRWGPIEKIEEHAFMFLPLYVPKRDRLVEYLEKNYIHTRYMMPLTTQPIVQKVMGTGLDKKFPVAKFVNDHGLLLGCHQYLDKKDLDYVVGVIKEFYESIDHRS